MTAEIRPATIADLEAILRIERESFADPWVADTFRLEFAQPLARVEVLCASDVGLVGFVDRWVVADELEIHDIAVAVAQRGRGYGRRLMEHALEQARRVGVRRALLDVRVSNEAAQRLYRSLGFTVVGLRRRYYEHDGEDALTMCLVLDPDHTPGGASEIDSGAASR